MKKSQEIAMYLVDAINAGMSKAIDDKIFDYSNDNEIAVFFHAMANLAPCYVYNKLTGEGVSILEFNHIANHLVMDNIQVTE